MAKANTRGPAQDALNQIAGLLNIEVTDPDLAWTIHDKISALQQVASVEDIVGQAVASALEGRSHAEIVSSLRALIEGFETEEAQDAFTATMLDELRSLFSQPEAVPAGLLDLWNASKDAIQEALMSDKKKDDDNAQPGGQPADDGERNATTTDAETRSEVIALRAETKGMREELEAMKAEKRSRDIDDYVRAKYAAVGLPVPEGEDRDELLELCRSAGDSWQKIVDHGLRGRNAPPQGVVTDPKGGPAAQSGGSTPHTQADAISRAKEELRSEKPDLSDKQLRLEAGRRAAKAHPSLFTPFAGGMSALESELG